ncbi:MAG: Trk system potassium transporter TrkA [Acidobacteriota bacterium]
MARRIVIVGAGVVGYTSAQRLSAEGHDVVLIERDEDAATEISDKLDIQVVVGNGCSLAVLREAELERADLLLAVTNSDEVNMITALIAGSQFQVETKVVRLRSQEYLDNISELAALWHGRTFGISPDRVAAERIVALLGVPHAVDVADVLEHRLQVTGFRVPRGCPIAGRTLADVRRDHPEATFLLAAIYRGDRAFLPRGDTRLEVGDVAYFAVRPEEAAAVARLLGFPEVRADRVVIGGGGRIGRLVARVALERGLRVAIIRRNRAEAERLAVEMPRALVLGGDITREEILLEAGIDGATFVAVTNSQEVNLLSSVQARQLGAERVITLVDSPTYVGLAEAAGIHASVSPRLASVGEILKFVRGLHVEEVQSLPFEKIEVSTVDVDDSSPLAGRPLRELGIPQGVLVAAVLDGDRVIVPDGETVIRPGSKAVLFSTAESAARLARLVD